MQGFGSMSGGGTPVKAGRQGRIGDDSKWNISRGSESPQLGGGTSGEGDVPCVEGGTCK